MKKKVGVIGAGIMGLTCGYELLKRGFEVTIFEKDNRVGGMSASFNFDGLEIERYYHFVCRADETLFDLLKEFGIFNSLVWKDTRMGFFFNGKLYRWGNPIYLLTFPGANFFSKMRYGWHIFNTSRRKRWNKLDSRNAVEWIKSSIGEKGYKIFWKPLFDFKFFQYKNNLSAAWIGTRIKRMGFSRKNVFTERLGYIEGGIKQLLDRMSASIKSLGGVVHLDSEVKKITVSGNRVDSLLAGGVYQSFDIILSTIPIPYVADIIPDLPQELLEQYRKIKNIGIICPILKLKRRITENFWLNISDKNIDIPGIIEFSNLNPLYGNILYIPFYLPRGHPHYSRPDKYFFGEVYSCLERINPHFSREWIKSETINRYEYAQPVCFPKFSDTLPPVKTPVDGLYIADTSFYYPQDRSMSESIRQAKQITAEVD